MAFTKSMTIRVDSSPPRGRIATGYGDRRTAHPKVSIVFDDDVFAVLRRRAVAENTTFAEQVRRALRKGLTL